MDGIKTQELSSNW